VRLNFRPPAANAGPLFSSPPVKAIFAPGTDGGERGEGMARGSVVKVRSVLMAARGVADGGKTGRGESEETTAKRKRRSNLLPVFFLGRVLFLRLTDCCPGCDSRREERREQMGRDKKMGLLKGSFDLRVLLSIKPRALASYVKRTYQKAVSREERQMSRGLLSLLALAALSSAASPWVWQCEPDPEPRCRRVMAEEVR